jgi:hypothetical protein
VGGKDGMINYPDSEFITGEILVFGKSLTRLGNEVKNDNGCFWKQDQSAYVSKKYAEAFPHLFRRLAWCDYRDDKIEVGYVRYIKTGIVLPASHTVYNGKMFFIGPSKKWEPGIRFEPADESDYQEYQKQKEA